MIKQLIYSLILILAVVACEEIYNPTLDDVDDCLVVEAILISNESQNEIYLYTTLGYNDESSTYPTVSGASVYLVDEDGNQTQCEETSSGTYTLNYNLETGATYHLYIEYNGEQYESGTQTVPEAPVVDSIYEGYTTQTTTTGAASSTDKLTEVSGFQFYADMNYEGGLNHYRFDARKIIQYYDYYDSIVPPDPDPQTFPIYCWASHYPTGSFNIAGPADYSTSKDISKHELDFFALDYNSYIADTMTFAGWIYILYQYGINEDTYEYYSDLNNQLDAEGKIFDPVYVQAEGNVSCTSNSDIVVLGNFEISSYSETRYFINYSKYRDSLYAFKAIPYFYDIPTKGAIKNDEPDFWERKSKSYPDE